MSRSKKKKPIFGYTTCESEKEDKRITNRKYRRKINQSLISGKEVLPTIREISNIWSFGKDGKHYYKYAESKDLRK